MKKNHQAKEFSLKGNLYLILYQYHIFRMDMIILTQRIPDFRKCAGEYPGFIFTGRTYLTIT